MANKQPDKAGKSNRSRAAAGRSVHTVRNTKAKVRIGLARRSRKGTQSAAKPRSVTKKQICLDILSRAKGVSIEELQDATGWQTHSVRWFLAGTVKKRLGLTLTSDKIEGEMRRYRIARPA